MMKTRIGWPRSTALVVVSGLVLGACTTPTAERSRATQIEPLLLAAGFQKRVADTPQKLAHLQQLDPLRMVPHARRGSVYYVLADPKGCQCAYVGNEQAFEQYQGLVLKQTIAQDKVSATRVDEDSMLNWGIWGPSFWE